MLWRRDAKGLLRFSRLCGVRAGATDQHGDATMHLQHLSAKLLLPGGGSYPIYGAPWAAGQWVCHRC